MTPQQATLLDSVLTTTLMLEHLDAELLSGPSLLAPRLVWLARVRERQHLADAVVRGLVALKRRQDPEAARAVRDAAPKSPAVELMDMALNFSDEEYPPREAFLVLLGWLTTPTDAPTEPDRERQDQQARQLRDEAFKKLTSKLVQHYGERCQVAVRALLGDSRSENQIRTTGSKVSNAAARSPRPFIEGRMALPQEVARLRTAITNAKGADAALRPPQTLIDLTLRTVVLLKSLEAEILTDPSRGRVEGRVRAEALRVHEQVAQALDRYVQRLDPKRPAAGRARRNSSRSAEWFE